MGGMEILIMKKFFDKENFLFPSFDKGQKIQSLIVAGGLMLFFLFSAFTFFNFMYCFADIIGSIVSGSPDVAIKDLLRSFPIFLSFFMSFWALLLFHGFFRNVDEERRNKSLFKNAICLIAFGGVNFLYILISRFIGKFSSLVEGSPSPIYPLDALLFSLLFIAIGVCALLYRLKFLEKLPYKVPSRAPIVTKARFVYCLGMAFWALIAVFGFAGFSTGLFIYDFQHGYAFYGIGLLFAYFVPFCFLTIWEFYYNELKPEKRKEFLFPLSLVGLGVSVLELVLYFVSLGTNTDAPSNAGFGEFPVAFTASVNIATLVVVATPLIVSIIALVKALLYRKEAK